MGQNFGEWLEEAFVAGPILGWRLWRTTADGTLMSVYKDVLWRAGTPLRANPKNPGEGVYALKDRIKEAPIGLQLHSNKVPQEVQFKNLILETFPEDKLTTLEEKKGS